jgi:hypothetical protein
MTTSTKARRPVKPVSGSCRWVVQMTDAHPGVLLINGMPYLVREHRTDGCLTGYALVKADGTVYDLPPDLSSCDCPDATFTDRPGGCKHRKALQAALAALAE